MSLLAISSLYLAIKHGRGKHGRDKSGRTSSPVLRDINLCVDAGQVMGLVGESGAGKSMLARTILGLQPESTRVRTGRIVFNDQDLLKLSTKALRAIVGRQIALIPQDPMAALNPVQRIGWQMSAGIRLHLGSNAESARTQSMDQLTEVNIRDPERVYNAYPHELSGGMRQRVLIAMAFSCLPQLIIADEPTTALDVTVQKRVLGLIKTLQQKNNTSLIFVTHDLGVVAKICDRVAVMYDGRILEEADVTALFQNPGHPYTAALLAATPRYDQPDKSIQPVSTELLQRLTRETEALDRETGGREI